MTEPIKHDSLFKTIMENPLAAREFLDYYLPSDFKELIDLSTIKPEKDSFVEEGLKRKISDLIYSVRFKDNDEKAFVYVLVEHQSSPDHWISLRLWKYMLLLAEKHKTKKDRLPLIAPLVFYNGSKKYDAPTSFWDLFTLPEQAKNLMGDKYRLIDLHSMTDDEIKQKQHLGMLEYFMKHIHTRDILKLWDMFLTEFKDVVLIDEKNGYFYIRNFLWYTDSKLAEDKQPELESVLARHLSKTTEEDVMRTIAQKYIEEGRAEGEARGEERALEKTAINMLKQNLDFKLVAQVTGLSLQFINQLKNSI
jgi:predicted transposase/invertase (TIGR01784 family)